MSEVTERQRTSRLLIVEDDEVQLRMLTAIMEYEGFEVIGCPTASAALEHVERRDVGVAVVDLRLPDLSGTELVEKIRACDDKVHVIINTAYSSYETAKDAVNLGAFAYVEKAGDPEELVRQVRRAFRARLERYAAGLEAAVAERTSDLQVANQMLRQEIAERRRTEEALKESEERFRTFFDDLGEAAYRADAQGNLTYVNKFSERLTGLALKEIIGKPLLCLFTEESQAVAVDAYQRTLNGQSPECELTFTTGKTCHFKNEPLRDKQNNIVGVFGIARDITERKRAEERLAQQQLELAHVARLSAMGEMAFGIAHELNQPLAAILNYAEAFRQTARSGQAEPVELLADLEDIVAEARRAGDIVHRLRNFVRKREPRRSSIELNELVQDAVRFVDYEARLKGVRIRLELAEGLPWIRGDATLLQQVVLNLITNAMEAMSGNRDAACELTVRTSIVGSDAVAVAVRDTGHGLPCESVDALFEPFFTTKPEGLGLGLSISRSIVEAEGGRLTGTPNPDRGMTFCFTLPVTHGDSRHGT